MMYRNVSLFTCAAAGLLVAGCYNPPPQNVPPMTANAPQYVVVPTQTTVVTPAPVATTDVVMYAPSAPPAPQVEAIPPAPSAYAYWEPGHWRWVGVSNGNPGWVWVGGHYANRPNTQAVWVPGNWTQTTSGWVWADGHWQ